MPWPTFSDREVYTPVCTAPAHVCSTTRRTRMPSAVCQPRPAHETDMLRPALFDYHPVIQTAVRDTANQKDIV